MSRSGYQNDIDEWALVRWRGAVRRAIRGQRGQAFLRDLLAEMDAMPEKVLIARELRDKEGDVCTLGAGCARRGVDPSKFDVDDWDHHEPLARALGIAPALVQEIEYLNDEYGVGDETPAKRFQRMREWIVSRLRSEEAQG